MPVTEQPRRPTIGIKLFCRLTLMGLAAAFAATPVVAQQDGRLEIGWLGRYTLFDSSLRFDDQFGTGGRLGVFLIPRLLVEADASRTVTEGWAGVDAEYVPVHAYVVYSQPVRPWSALRLGVGYVHNEYFGHREGADNGFAGLVALQVNIAGPLSLRVDGTVDHMPKPANLASHNWQYGLQAGVTLAFGRAGGRKAPVDMDGDGVPDQSDVCPDTRIGATVDGRGCALPEDGDADGVVDRADECPDTPAGRRVGVQGCPLPEDADGDGVADPDDACPDTAPDLDVDPGGCPLPRDGDADGVSDSVDACPDTPVGLAVDERGCRLVIDHDGDGVPDAADACPNTRLGELVDARGCRVVLEPGRALVLEGVSFRSSTAALTPESHAVLDRVARSLIANPEVKVEVAGYTDSSGDRDYNMRLSLARANVVRWYLINRGVTAERLAARGHGPADPVDTNDTPKGRARNRRVELRRIER